jgi:autotransporter strand-loop-strand O-heptosyltransferase
MNRHFLTHTTKNYEHVTINLARSLKKYSKNKLVVYTVDYEASDDLKSLTICRRIDLNIPLISDGDLFFSSDNFYVNRNSVNIYHILGSKIDCMIKAIKDGAKEWVYIDGDSIANLNVDDLFKYTSQVNEVPLATKGPYEYILLTHQDGSVDGNPFWKGDGSADLTSTIEYPMMSFFNMEPNMRGVYSTTNILVGTDKVLPFLELWRDVHKILPRVTNTYKKSPLHEETIFNVLKWKKGDCSLPMVYINAITSETVKHFFENETDSDTIIEPYYKLPKEKEQITVFHGIKKQSEVDKVFELLDSKIDKKMKVLYLAPHLSTGGMPQFLLKRIKSLMEFRNDIEIYVVEFMNYSPTFVVQKNEIIKLVGSSRFWTLGDNKFELIDIIKDNNIDVVHIDEMIEGFDSFNKVPQYLMDKLYSDDRTWRVIETCHNVWFNPESNKLYHPDGYLFCTPWHLENTFKNMESKKIVSEYPLENFKISNEEKIEYRKKLGLSLDKKHIVNVGLWTQGKNQGEGVEIARLLEQSHPEYEFHFIGNQAPNFEEYWSPIMSNLPSNVSVWGERADVVDFLKSADLFMFNSTWECAPIVLKEAISYGLPILARNLQQYMGMYGGYITELENDLISNSKKLVSLIETSNQYSIPENGLNNFISTHMEFYKEVIDSNPQSQSDHPMKLKFNYHFVGNPFFEVLGPKSDSKFTIEYIEPNGNILYNNIISTNNWVRLNREYYTDYTICLKENNKIIFLEKINFENKKVFIVFDSHSLGDTISWIPYCLEFKKKHNCDVIVSCKWSEFFLDVYPELNFVQPGSTVHNLHGMYKLGWFWDTNKEPEICNTIPLQKTATNILGLDYSEIKPRINFNKKDKPYEGKYITIATHSTSGLKYWNYPNGWQNLIDNLTSIGYKIVSISKEKTDLKNVIELEDTSIKNTMNVIYHSEFFIGLSSGLSWLSWALGKHVVMISNFTEDNHEFTSNTTRIVNKSVCNGCWNNPMFKFDKGDWNWCPEHKDTPRQFECHKSITPEMVINQIQHLLK